MKNTNFIFFIFLFLLGCGNVNNKTPSESVIYIKDYKKDSTSGMNTNQASEDITAMSPNTKSNELNSSHIESNASQTGSSNNDNQPERDSKTSQEGNTNPKKGNNSGSENVDKGNFSHKSPEDKPVKPPIIVKIPKDVVSSQGDKSDIHVHKLFNTLLSKYVNSLGEVDYVGISKDKDLDKYLTLIRDNTPAQSWTKEQKQTYWINAYNAFTIKKIVDNYPIQSLRDLDGGKTWDVKWISLGNKLYSLNNIEIDILRPMMMDARLHFALFNGAKSCPPLYNKAFIAGKLYEELDARTTMFINNSKYNKLGQQSATISKIFEWNKSEFGDLIAFFNKYSRIKLLPGTNLKFVEYDWQLNQK